VRYREFPPVPELAAIVDRVWTVEGERGEHDPEPILPDGRPELILHLGSPFERVGSDGASERQPTRLVAGQLTGQLLVRPTGTIAVLGVRFHPHGAAAVFDAPQHELTGQPMALDAIAPPLARTLAAVQNRTADPLEAAVLVQRALVGSVDRARLDPRIALAVAAIGRTCGRVSIDRLAAAAEMTRRHLERRFLTAVGVSPKRLARIARFQRALRLLGSDTRRPGTDTAAACGYADQAHFVRDFSRLAGCSPGEHLLRHGELTGFFIERRGNGGTPAVSPSRGVTSTDRGR
jgi:AraC-like DNA-binding protein